MLTLIVFLLILTVSVVIHELAHYLNAKSVGVPVNAFSVGFGPVLWRKRWRGTEWRISALPLGGYVELDGMMPEADERGVMRYPTTGFMAKNFWQKAWILVGGVIANFILAICLLATAITAAPNSGFRAQVTGQIPESSGARFASIVEDSYAERYGLVSGDVVLRINGITNPTTAQVQAQIQTANRLELLVKRGADEVRISETWPPDDIAGRPLLGVGLEPLEVETLPPIGFGAALLETTGFLVRIVPESVSGFVRSLGQTVTGQRSEEVIGPVGMVSLTGQAAQAGVIPVLTLAGLINFSLALFNLLPIPGLDGGRILFAAVTAIRGRPFKPGQEEFVNFMGFAFLMLFIILVTFGEVGDLLAR